MKRIDQAVMQKFATATAILMTRVFSTPPVANQRRLMVACGPAMGSGPVISIGNDKFDVLGLGFKPGSEWKGPSEIFVEEMRDGELVTWKRCRLWADVIDGPLYLMTDDPNVFFSYDGYSLVILGGDIEDRDEGARRALLRLRAAARRVPDDLPTMT